MLRLRHASSTLLLAGLLAGCGQQTPTPTPTATPEATNPSPPVAGAGWTLVRTVTPTPNNEGVAVAPLGRDQVLVSITVRGPGADGCGTPSFVGFQQAGSILNAKIVRSPTSDSCATTSAVTFYIAVDRKILQPGVAVDRIGVGENCEGPTCTAEIPRPS
jgi:hypothetical protein